jgi:DNA-binding NarL/FixJ family response regulator
MSTRFGGPILVVDRADDARERLVHGLTGDGLEVRVADDAETALALALDRRPGLVLTEVNLPGRCGYELLRRLRDLFGESLPIVFLSGERTESFDRVAGMLLGADDYLTKPFSEDELLARVRRLVRASAVNGANRNALLTTREREVLQLLAAGKSQREIATSLVIAPKTCAKHIERILEKLGVHSRAQAVAVAYRDELVADRG